MDCVVIRREMSIFQFESKSRNTKTRFFSLSLSFHAFLESLSAPLVHRFVTSYYYYYNEMYSLSLSLSLYDHYVYHGISLGM